VGADPGDVARQQVGGELDPPHRAVDGPRERLGEHGLAYARHVLDEQVALGEQDDQREPDRLGLPVDDRLNGRGDLPCGADQFIERPCAAWHTAAAPRVEYQKALLEKARLAWDTGVIPRMATAAPETASSSIDSMRCRPECATSHACPVQEPIQSDPRELPFSPGTQASAQIRESSENNRSCPWHETAPRAVYPHTRVHSAFIHGRADRGARIARRPRPERKALRPIAGPPPAD